MCYKNNKYFLSAFGACWPDARNRKCQEWFFTTSGKSTVGSWNCCSVPYQLREKTKSPSSFYRHHFRFVLLIKLLLFFFLVYFFRISNISLFILFTLICFSDAINYSHSWFNETVSIGLPLASSVRITWNRFVFGSSDCYSVRKQG